MNDILNKLHEVAASPRAQMDGYLAQPVAASHARLERQEKPVTSLNFSSDHFLPVISSS